MRAENGFGFRRAVGLPDVFDVQDGEHDAFGIAQGDFAAAGLELLREFFGDVERDRHRPENAAGQPHVAADAFVVGLVHEAGERREAAAQQQFEVADLARRSGPRTATRASGP